jgi:hypothetical protein
LILLVRPAGFEPAAYGFVVRRSIRAELRAREKPFEISVEHKLKVMVLSNKLWDKRN